MTTLAPKLPWSHAYAGGFPRMGGQSLVSDADAQDYLNRVKAADGGVGVEVGVAQAIDAFVKGCKSDSAGYSGDPTRTNWDAIQACCIMAGARTISGALVPLKRPYGAELVDIENLPTPTLYDASGSTAVWNAGTRTASNATTGTSTTYPRFLFQVGMTSGKRYRVSGVLSGDLSRIYGGGFRINGSGYIAVDLTTGAFDGIATAGSLEGTDGGIELLLNGYFIASVTIESLSIREDSFTPTAQGGWTASDYSRGGTTPGLKGDGSTLYLDSNRANDSDGLNDRHLAIYKTSTTLATEWHIGVYDTTAPNHNTGIRGIADATERFYSSNLGSEAVIAASPSGSTAGLRGVARTSATNVNYFTPTESGSASINSTREEPRNCFVFALNLDGAAYTPSASRLAFYSIGSACDLAALDARVSALMAAIQAFLP